MKQPLYIFNPEHDLALANNDSNFNAPLSALQLAADLEHLPIWYAQPQSYVMCRAGCSNEWLESLNKLFPQIESVQFKLFQDISEVSSVKPWGWDKAIHKQISNNLITTASPTETPTIEIPDENQLEKIRELSHRRIAIRALQFLHSRIAESDYLALPAHEISSIDDVVHFAKSNAPVVFKAPWSGSGKGLCWVRSEVNKSQRGWCSNAIDKQGSLIAEKAYKVIQDFALLFSCENGKTAFAGYSLFETENGVYRNNLLMSNEAIFELLTVKWINPGLLISVQLHLQQFIETEIAPHYSGMLGVDMFVFEQNNHFKLHPCVEINLRMTMGCVARIFFDRFVHPEASGRFFMDYFPAKGELWTNHLEKTKQFPILINGGKIQAAYLSLTPITPFSNYRISVEI